MDDWSLNEVAPEELIGVFGIDSALQMCKDCDKRELEVIKEKSCAGCYFELVRCKHREECRDYAMYNLGEGGVK